MSRVGRFAAINTKVKTLSSKLLKKKDYENLIESKSVKDVVEYLKNNTAYKTVLNDINLQHIKVDEIEIIFKKYIISQYRKLIHYFTDEYRKLFKIIFLRYEIEDLKLYLRTIMRNESLKDIGEFIVYSGIHSNIDHEILTNSNDMEEFISNLKGTIYYEILKPYMNEDKEKRLFYMEMSLDGIYFKQLNKQIEKLHREDRRILTELLGQNIDLLNLQWIYRGLKFYRLSPEELINYTLSNGLYLNFNKLKELCYSDNEKVLIDKMVDSKYGFLFDNKDTLEIFMERRIERYLYFLFLEYKKREKMNIIESIVYMHLLEYEMRDIFSIIEAIRYGLNPEESKKFLVRRI